MAIFNSYVKLPEGNNKNKLIVDDFVNKQNEGVHGHSHPMSPNCYWLMISILLILMVNINGYYMVNDLE